MDVMLVVLDKDEFEGVRRMKAGRGGDRASRANSPSSLSCSSRLVVSASVASRSCEFWRDEAGDGRRVEPSEESEDVEGEVISDERDDFALRADFGAAMGMTTPDFLRPDRENFGAFLSAMADVSNGDTT